MDKDFQDAIAGEAIVVFVRDLFNVSHVVEASMGTTGLGIMQMLYPIVELLPWQYVLIFGGRALGLEVTLQAAGVAEGNTLHMLGKVAGGGKRAASKSAGGRAVIVLGRDEKMRELAENIAHMKSEMNIDAMTHSTATFDACHRLANSIEPGLQLILGCLDRMTSEELQRVIDTPFVGGTTEFHVSNILPALLPDFARIKIVMQQAENMTACINASFLRAYVNEYYVNGTYKNSDFRAHAQAVLTMKQTAAAREQMG